MSLYVLLPNQIKRIAPISTKLYLLTIGSFICINWLLYSSHHETLDSRQKEWRDQVTYSNIFSVDLQHHVQCNLPSLDLVRNCWSFDQIEILMHLHASHCQRYGRFPQSPKLFHKSINQWILMIKKKKGYLPFFFRYEPHLATTIGIAPAFVCFTLSSST